MRTLLSHLLGVVEKHNLDIDSVTATPYAIRLVLSHGFASMDEWMDVSNEMGFGYRPDWSTGKYGITVEHMSFRHSCTPDCTRAKGGITSDSGNVVT
jgi:hypothetical protein